MKPLFILTLLFLAQISCLGQEITDTNAVERAKLSANLVNLKILTNDLTHKITILSSNYESAKTIGTNNAALQNIEKQRLRLVWNRERQVRTIVRLEGWLASTNVFKAQGR